MGREGSGVEGLMGREGSGVEGLVWCGGSAPGARGMGRVSAAPS